MNRVGYQVVRVYCTHTRSHTHTHILFLPHPSTHSLTHSHTRQGVRLLSQGAEGLLQQLGLRALRVLEEKRRWGVGRDSEGRGNSHPKQHARVAAYTHPLPSVLAITYLLICSGWSCDGEGQAKRRNVGRGLAKEVEAHDAEKNKREEKNTKR